MPHNPIIYDSDEESQIIHIGASHTPNRRQPPRSSSQALKDDHNSEPEPEPEQDLPPYNPLDHGVYDSYKDYDNILDFKDRYFRQPNAYDDSDEEDIPGLMNNDEPPYRGDIDSGSLPFFLSPLSSNERYPEKSDGGKTRTSEARSPNLQRLYDSLAATVTNHQDSTYRQSERCEQFGNCEYPEASINALGHRVMLNIDGEVKDPMYEAGIKIWYEDLGSGWGEVFEGDFGDLGPGKRKMKGLGRGWN